MLDKKQLRHLANLARVGLSDEELEKLMDDLNSILGYVDEINKLKSMSQYEVVYCKNFYFGKTKHGNAHTKYGIRY